jgi:hypothetical protein
MLLPLRRTINLSSRRFMGGFLSELKLVFRQLAKSPGFTATAVLKLAFGIGATAAIFSGSCGFDLSRSPRCFG